MILYSTPEGLEESIDSIDLDFKLKVEAGLGSLRFVPLEIDACPVAPGTPRTRGLGTIAFHFARLAQLASKMGSVQSTGNPYRHCN